MKKKIIVGIITMLLALTYFTITNISNAADVVETWDISKNDGQSHVTATLYSDGKFVISGTGNMANYSFGNQPYYESKDDIKTVTIEDSVTYIGRYAFCGCTSLSEIELPNSVISIGAYAFYNCTSLTQINILNSVTSIGDYAFNNCTSLTEIKIPNSVTSIGRWAFCGCTSLSEIEIPNSVISIEGYTFYDCTSLVEIEIPNSVTSIGDYAFNNCTSLTEIEIPNNVTSIGRWSFCACSGLTNITISEGVKNIEEDAFSKCTSLEEIEIPSSVTNIGGNIFSLCSILRNIVVSENNQNYISIGGILYNKEMTELIVHPAKKENTIYVIPETVTNIRKSAFYNCTNLIEIILPEGVTNIGSSAFSGCISLSEIEIPNSVTNIGSSAFSGCTSLIQIEIPNSVTSIGGLAFYRCTSLTQINIPNGVTSIEGYTFCQCTSLTEINIPDSVTIIENEAFLNCSSLTTVKMPEGVTNIGNSAFDGCRSLSEIEIPNSVTSIGYSAFVFCTSLKQIYIPKSVIYIGSSAFSECENLTIYTNSEYVENYAKENNIGYILDKTGPSITFEKNPIDWTNDTVTITIMLTDDIVGVKEVLVDNELETLENDIIKIIANENRSYQIVAKDKLGNISETTIIIDNIDKVKPVIEKIEGNMTKWTKENVTLEITARDTLSGIKDYSFDGGTTWQASNEKIYSENTENIIVKVRDNVGNMAEYEPISITKIDKENPVIERIEGNSNDWAKQKTLKVITNDTLSGIKDYSFDGGNTWQESNEKTYSENVENVVIKVRDNVGNITEYEPISITKIIKLERIEIRQQPEKTEYTEGENFNTKGMKVVAIYDNGTEEEIARYTIINGNNLREGQESVTIRYKEGDIIKETTQAITVSKRIEPEIEDYEVRGEEGKKYLENIKAKTTIRQLKEKIRTNGTIEVYKGSIKITEENKIVGTGMKIKVKQNNQEVIYEAVVKGDLTGDGNIKMADLLKLARYKAGVDKSLEGAYLRAGDVVKDEKIGMPDILKLSRVLAGIENI